MPITCSFSAEFCRCRLGTVLTDQHRLPEAVEVFGKAIELKPQSAEAYTNLGRALQRQGKLTDAEAAYHKAIELSPLFYDAYQNLGDALVTQRKPREAEAACRKAIDLISAHHQQIPARLGAFRKDLEGKLAAAQANLGVALHFQERYPEAEAACARAVELAPDLAAAHYMLGFARHRQHKLPPAEAAYSKAIALDPSYFEAHVNLGLALQEQPKPPGAIAAWRKALELSANSGGVHWNLAGLLREQGEFADSLAHFKRAHQLGYPPASTQLVRRAERLAELDGRLPRILKGAAHPTDVEERLALAELCALPSRQLYAASVRYYSEAFAADRKLEENLDEQCRYSAACSAALAGCGQGKDTAGLGAKERSRLRDQALRWLRAELTARRSQLEKEPTQAGPMARQAMQHWQRDPDFDGVHGDLALAKLPEAEREEWGKLWQDVEELRKRAAAE